MAGVVFESDIVRSLEKMSQSNRSPLELDSPQISTRITYVKPPLGSGLFPSNSDEVSFPPKKNCGRKRRFDTGKLLEIFANEKKRREQISAIKGCGFLNDEAGEGDEEERSDEEDIDEEMMRRGEDDEEEDLGDISSVVRGRSGETNKMRNNVTENCLFHAIHQALCYFRYKTNPTVSNKTIYKNTLRKNGHNPLIHKKVFDEVEKMKTESGISKSTNFGWLDIDQVQKTVFSGLFQIICFEQNSTLPFYAGPYLGEKHSLVLYLEEGHYCGVRSIVALLKTSYYCCRCQVKYRDASSHYSCKLVHRKCGKKCPVSEDDIPMECETCHVTFRSEICFQNHLEQGKRGGKSRCAHTKFCSKCESSYYRNKNSRPHECGETYCHRCQVVKAEVHYCTMRESEKHEKNITRIRCYYDIESRTDPVTGQQFPVLFIGFRCCPACSSTISKDFAVSETLVCGTCSPQGRLKMIECVSEENRDVDVASSIVNYLFDKEHKGTVAVAHNSSGYDGQFVLENLISSSKTAPEVCLDGTKLIFLRFKGVRMIDSLKYLGMSLSAMGKTFEIESPKGDFPVHFIRPENFDYVGPVPADEFYGLENKSADARKKLVDFLADEREAKKLFAFLKELITYCWMDVYILASSLIIFEREFEAMTQVCLFEESVTIASAAILSYRRNHLNSLFPIVLDSKPSASYNSSIKSHKLLLWLAHKEKVHIEISTTSGEHKVGAFRVDGFIPKCEKFPEGQVVEFNGCYYHGHSCKFAEDSVIGDRTAKEIREEDEKRIKKIEEEYPVRVIWECEVDKELCRNEEMRKFFENTEAKELLQMQRALVGGRTEIFKLTANNEGQDLYYVDVVSLYPFVMKHKLFPVGIPQDVLASTFNVPLTCWEDIGFSGFLQCKILPPQDLLLPVIADKSLDKLLFALCRACAKEQNNGECEHTDDERSFTGVYTTMELTEAMRLGYIITEVYHGIAYENWLGNDEAGKGGLFTSYVNDNMCEKIYASGFPSDVKTEEQQREFIETCEMMEQTKLVPEKFMKNPGKRAVAKLMLNSLWGKMAQRVDKLRTEVIMDPAKFFAILHDTALEVLDVRPINDTLIVQYRTRDEKLASLRTSAGHIAACTTAYGRLELYKFMEMVGAHNMIYCDTDSLIYSVPAGQENPLKDYMGHHLGQLTSELKGTMVKFDGTGPKSYSYKEILEDGGVKTVVKAKGISLNSDAEKMIRQEKMAQMVREVLDGVVDRTEVQVPQFGMKRNKNHQVFAKNFSKTFKFTFNKRKVLPDGSTLPFGYKK